MNPGDRERLDLADASIQLWCSKWVMSRHIGANPSKGFGTDIHSVRSTLTAVGSLRAATYATGSMTRLGVRLKTDDENILTIDSFIHAFLPVSVSDLYLSHAPALV